MPVSGLMHESINLASSFTVAGCWTDLPIFGKLHTIRGKLNFGRYKWTSVPRDNNSLSFPCLDPYLLIPGPNPCELRCKAEPDGLEYGFGKVSNGTPCPQGVCLDGRCLVGRLFGIILLSHLLWNNCRLFSQDHRLSPLRELCGKTVCMCVGVLLFSRKII